MTFSGLFLRKTATVPVNRIQNVDTQQGPLLQHLPFAKCYRGDRCHNFKTEAIAEDVAQALRDRLFTQPARHGRLDWWLNQYVNQNLPWLPWWCRQPKICCCRLCLWCCRVNVILVNRHCGWAVCWLPWFLVSWSGFLYLWANVMKSRYIEGVCETSDPCSIWTCANLDQTQ